MRGIRKSVKMLTASLGVLCALLFSGTAVLDSRLPDRYQVVEGQRLTIGAAGAVQAVYAGAREKDSAAMAKTSGENYAVELRLFGLFPLKAASVEVVDELYVQPSGEPFGVKIYTEGVIVVGFSEVDAAEGGVMPAREAGILEGDNIKSIGGKAVTSNADIAARIEGCGGRPVSVELRRGDKALTLTLVPAFSESEGRYKAGVWVRDSSAGIGTLTFYSPSLGVAAGLGHGICDVDTDKLLPLSTGEMVGAEIFGIDKSVSGSPGELRGRFTGKSLGNLLINGETGIYGAVSANGDSGSLVRIAMKQEVQTGAAEILCTLDGETPKSYKCEIEKVHFNDDNLTQNMIVKVTDPDLLSKCGGIVQGMSGSPILQGGKLIGAITHVFIGEPERGYAIFAETMYNTALSVEDAVKQSVS